MSGILTWTKGDIYIGEWVDAKRHGKGVMKLIDGYVYSGEWLGDKCHGNGVWTRADGRVYNVEWKDGKEHTVSHGKLWFRRVSDLTVKGIVARLGQPESIPANYVLFAVISIVLFCFKLSMKNTQPEFTGRAILIGAPTPQDPRADGALHVAVLLSEHRECSICYESFSTNTGATEKDIRERSPVQSATCRHYFCHGCILRVHAQRATFWLVPERISCCICSAENAFCLRSQTYIGC